MVLMTCIVDVCGTSLSLDLYIVMCSTGGATDLALL